MISARFGLESLPDLDWNRCPVWIGITARFGLESLPGLDWNRCPVWIGIRSLINKRCKGQQHMRWSREGLNPILQIRAAMGSDDWNIIREMAVMNVVNHTNKT